MRTPDEPPATNTDAEAVPPLTWPEEWDGNLRGSRRRSIKLCIATAALAFVSVFATTPTTFLTTAAPALILLTFAVTSYLASQLDLRRTIDRVRLEPTRGGHKVFIPVHRWYKALYHLGNIAVLAFAIEWLYLGLTVDVDERRAILVYLMTFTFGPALAVWSFARLFSRLLFRFRGPQMGLTISENGISQISWWGETHFEWKFIKDVLITRAYAPRLVRPGRSPSYISSVGLTPTDRGKKRLRGHFPSLPVTHWPLVGYRAMIIDVAELDVYPPAIPHLLKFYFEHPELRSELGTEKALERIRTGNFVA